MELNDIKINGISDMLPLILYKKFKKLNIQNLQDVISLSPSKFREHPGIGKKVVDMLQELQSNINSSKDSFIDQYLANTKIYLLPLDKEITDEENFLELLGDTITDYINLFPKHASKGIIKHYYGLGGEVKYTIEELAIYYNLTRERIRQLRMELVANIRLLLEGKHDKEFRCSCKSEISCFFKQLESFLLEKNAFTFEELKNWLIEEFNCFKIDNHISVVDLLLDLFQFSRCGKVESSFSKGDFIIVNSSEKTSFLKAANEILTSLRKSIIPMNEMQIVIEVKRRLKKIENQLIIVALNCLPEVEILESGNQKLFQVKFSELSNARDRAYRVLLEKGTSMYLDDLVSEINHRLINSSTSKIYDRFSLALGSDSRFLPKQKTGYWDLKEWNLNSDTIEDLVKGTLYKLNKPSTSAEIIALIHLDRPQLKETSIKSLIGRDCIKVEGERWILSEWKQKYNDLAFSKRKRRINTKEPEHRIEQREHVIKFLQKKPENLAFASEIIKSIKDYNKRKYTNVSFYKLFEEEEYFIKLQVRNRVQVSLKQIDRNTKLYVDEFNWKRVKEKLYTEIEDAFSQPEAPKYSCDIKDALEIFYELIEWKSGEYELDGLGDRILGNINNFFYESSNRTDKLNYLKQFLTSLDPFLKKILYINNESDYYFIKQHKKGLGEIIEKLSNIDPTNERFKANERFARKIKFGKQLNLVYRSRNTDTHGAKNWSEYDIMHISISCFIIYVYSVCEYLNEIRNKINTT